MVGAVRTTSRAGDHLAELVHAGPAVGDATRAAE